MTALCEIVLSLGKSSCFLFIGDYLRAFYWLCGRCRDVPVMTAHLLLLKELDSMIFNGSLPTLCVLWLNTLAFWTVPSFLFLFNLYKSGALKLTSFLWFWGGSVCMLSFPSQTQQSVWAVVPLHNSYYSAFVVIYRYIQFWIGLQIYVVCFNSFTFIRYLVLQYFHINYTSGNWYKEAPNSSLHAFILVKSY